MRPDRRGLIAGSAKQVDVHAAAQLMLKILTGKAIQPGDEMVALPSGLVGLQPWFGRALGVNETRRFQTGREAADEFGQLLQKTALVFTIRRGAAQSSGLGV